ncbi:aldo/keto reductase [Jeotgalibaca ciconiae]|uniref:Aldo/keto reductase n=1 Tax=Jeotgalibaca ciconiae TaxID=2496265 RepID=A0A3Q9BJ65_9LACT|nr:aldo/keto reductase [Jeotgalibaca ciconiae]AZP03617.1 aldo/keto reductase [Jeotgalibaca ciconiae]HJB24251.1 aldo/keto reductase [Candidatus Jeotgalibaca pullicola]
MHKKIPKVTLNDGSKLPAVGLGTISLKGATGVNELLSAFNLGYRLIDTSTNYENEGTVGEAIRRSGIPREEFIISSKLPGSHHAHDEAILMIQEQAYRIGLDYFDKYLIHWPNPKVGMYVDAWKALIDAQKFGLIRTIGVSNFLPEHLDRIIEETGVTPATNQIELHPYFNQEELREYHAKKGIITESWSPFGREKNDVLEDETILAIAKQHKKTAAQVIVRWNIQLGNLPIVRSGNHEHQKENLAVFDFELSQDEMNQIAKLTKPDGRIEDQDPAEYEEFV